MSVITQLSHDDNGPLDLTLYDPNTEQEYELHAVDLEGINVLAVDSAFERGTPVNVGVDKRNHIIRVETVGPAPYPPLPVDPGPPGFEFAITRIATQRTKKGLIAEVFVTKNPAAELVEENQILTSDPIMHTLCHGAFLSNRRLNITTDQGRVKQVVKRRL
jgi:hypothetical protein